MENLRTIDTGRIENFLKGYGVNGKLLALDKYDREFIHASGDESEIISEVAFARPKMFEVRRFIMGLENGDEKLFLYYHYVKGLSVARCGELFGIARSSAYRLKDRALVMAAREALRRKIF